MNYNQIAAQAVDFQKTAFTNWYNTVAMIQDQSASAMEMMISQSGLPMPKVAHKAVKSCLDAYQEGFKRFYSYVEGGFSSIEAHLVQGTKLAPAEPAKIVTEEKKAAPEKPTKLTVAEKKTAPAKKTKTK